MYILTALECCDAECLDERSVVGSDAFKLFSDRCSSLHHGSEQFHTADVCELFEERVSAALVVSISLCSQVHEGCMQVILWLYYGMKTAISLPDHLFRSGDSLAKRLGVSRSELYARALAEFVAKYKAERVTQRLNSVYAAEDSRIDPALANAQLKASPRESW